MEDIRLEKRHGIRKYTRLYIENKYISNFFRPALFCEGDAEILAWLVDRIIKHYENGIPDQIVSDCIEKGVIGKIYEIASTI